MTKKAKLYLFLFLFIASTVFIASYLPYYWGDPGRTVAMAFAEGGPLSLGYDYLGRPICPQLLSGGKTLLLASLGTALLTQLLGLFFGFRQALGATGVRTQSFLFDLILLLPMTLLSLVAFSLLHGSIYGVIPVAALLTVPFSSRYYAANTKPLLQSGFYEQALVAGDRPAVAIIREILPALKRPILTDFGISLIGAVYLLSTVSFLGGSTETKLFLWPIMVAKNLQGLALNPWATLAPMLGIILLTIPLNLWVDSLEKRGVAR